VIILNRTTIEVISAANEKAAKKMILC